MSGPSGSASWNTKSFALLDGCHSNMRHDLDLQDISTAKIE